MDWQPHVEQAIAALRQGAVQSADDILSATLQQSKEERVEQGYEPPPPPPEPKEQLTAILMWVCSRLGSPAVLEDMIRTLEKSS